MKQRFCFIVLFVWNAGLNAKGPCVINAYDELNRTSVTTYPDGSRIEYAYDANGNRTMCRTEGPQLRATVYLLASEVPGTAGSVVLDVTANGPWGIYVRESMRSVTPAKGPSAADATLNLPQRAKLLPNQNC